jgi:hypothetical protein
MAPEERERARERKRRANMAPEERERARERDRERRANMSPVRLEWERKQKREYMRHYCASKKTKAATASNHEVLDEEVPDQS